MLKVNWKFDNEVNLMYTDDIPGRNWYMMFIGDDLFVVVNECSEGQIEFDSAKNAFRAVEIINNTRIWN